jgi:carotenoid cleavage dioxygenase
VFAPRPGSTTEDDGWVVTVLSHPDEAHSEAWVIPAQDLASGPIARVRLPWRVPLGFHATWVPEASGPSA